MTRIRVLLWIPRGLYRSVVLDALHAAPDLEVLDEKPRHRSTDAANAVDEAELRETIARVRPDVVVVPTPDRELRRVVGEATGYSAVFVSTDGRTALAYDHDVSASSLCRLIRTVAACGTPS